MNLDKVRLQLLEHEGLRLKPYKDTSGKTTIGVGRNLDDRGLTKDEALFLLENDIISVLDVLHRGRYAWWDAVRGNEAREHVIIDMVFNLGINGLLGFKKMLRLLCEGNFIGAALEMMDSKWSVQVGGRATRLAEMMRTGQEVPFQNNSGGVS